MENKKVFIGNLDFAVTEEEIRILLSDYGTVVHIKMHKKKGCAFVEMSDEAEAALAIEKLNGIKFKDREIRISLEMKANKAKALSIKKYNERLEGFSRQKKSMNPDSESRNETDSHSMESESNHKASGFADRSSHEYKRNRPAAHRPADSRHPRKKEWSHDKPSHPNRTSRDGQKSGYGRSPEPETNYNSRERFPGPDERPTRNYSRGRSEYPHPRRKEWSHDKPAHPNRTSRDGQKSGYGRSPKPETNYNSRERFSSPDERPTRNYSRGKSDYPHPQRKEWSHDKPAYPNRKSRDGQKSGHGRSPKPEINYNSRERFPSPDERPVRDYSRGKSNSPHPQRKEWSHDKPAYSSRPSGPSRHAGARTRDDSKPRHPGGSPNRFSPSSRPKSGSRGNNNSDNSARPKVRGGGGNRDRNNRPKRD